MKLTRHNGRAGKMALIILNTMTEILIFTTASILMILGQREISTGTVTMVTGTLFMRIKQTNSQVPLKKWSNTFMLPNTRTL